METPVVLELEPENHIQVTLFNANHCTGAVMFCKCCQGLPLLIPGSYLTGGSIVFEGQGKAVLYTGDIRSEPWFVDAIARSPCMVEYASGLKTLDIVYLDTSFTDDCFFPSKADGIKELLQKVPEYPPETVFHFQAWTYGYVSPTRLHRQFLSCYSYEDVWIALSKALGTQVSFLNTLPCLPL
jgi:DNA cross-link repair 1C protein